MRPGVLKRAPTMGGMATRRAIGWLDTRLYPEFQDHWDDSLFRAEIMRALRSNDHVLDLGAGAGLLPEMNFKGVSRSVCGVDLDPRVGANRNIDAVCVADAEALPFADQVFDIVFSNNVLEHLSRPERVFREVGRVLRPGGRFLIKTPNRSHYVPLIAMVTPQRFHVWFNRLRGRAGDDTFPTRYRANAPRDIERLAAGSGFLVERLSLIEGRPEYCRIAVPLYLAGAAYERLVNMLPVLRRFRVLLIGVLRKSEL
jgi:SAM-dependent methyltransferase